MIETPGPGGAETVMGALVTGASAEFRSLAVVPDADSWLARSVPEHTARAVKPSPRAETGLIDLPYLRALRRLVVTERPAVVHAHSFDAALYASLAVRGLDVRLLATFHGASDLRRTGWRNRVKWALLRRADAIVAVSHALDVIARGVPGVLTDRLHVIHNGIDLKKFSPAPHTALRERLGVERGTILIGAVGNVRAPKGYDVLMHAMSALRADGFTVHLAVAGDDVGPLADSLRALCGSLALSDRVSFVGFLEDVPAFLNGIDLYVLPSLSEGFSLSTVQALATGLPVVATRSGGPEEIIDDASCGLLVPPGSPKELAQAIGELIASPDDRDRLGRHGRERALSAFSVQVMVREYEALYRRLLQ